MLNGWGKTKKELSVLPLKTIYHFESQGYWNYTSDKLSII